MGNILLLGDRNCPSVGYSPHGLEAYFGNLPELAVSTRLGGRKQKTPIKQNFFDKGNLPARIRTAAVYQGNLQEIAVSTKLGGRKEKTPIKQNFFDEGRLPARTRTAEVYQGNLQQLAVSTKLGGRKQKTPIKQNLFDEGTLSVNVEPYNLRKKINTPTEKECDKRVKCSKCNEYVHKAVLRLHDKYYCGTQPEEQEWKLYNTFASCNKCKSRCRPDAIEFHVKFLCGKKPLAVQCFYCPHISYTYFSLIMHMLCSHKKKHKYLDLLSVLPTPEPSSEDITPMRVVKNFFNNSLTAEAEAVSAESGGCDTSLRIREKSSYTCRSCGEVIVGTHAYQNHINTRCGTEHHYICFFCPLRAEYAYEVLDHMEQVHDQTFNTYDLIQAQMTGIIPQVDGKSSNALNTDLEVDFSDNRLFEPYVPDGPLLDITEIKTEWNENINPEIENNAIKIKSEFGLNVSKERAIEKPAVRGRRTQVKYDKCGKCGEEVHPQGLRIHKKYICGKESVERKWIMKGKSAFCLICKSVKRSHNIDFHVKYQCKKRPYPTQCFYCPHVYSEYMSLLQHMFKAHSKIHYYADLLDILPDPDTDTDPEQGKKVIRHPAIYTLPDPQPVKATRSNICKTSSQDFFACLYCKYSNKAAYLVIDHMEDIHGKEHNIYDLFDFKMGKK